MSVKSLSNNLIFHHVGVTSRIVTKFQLWIGRKVQWILFLWLGGCYRCMGGVGQTKTGSHSVTLLSEEGNLKIEEVTPSTPFETLRKVHGLDEESFELH